MFHTYLIKLCPGHIHSMRRHHLKAVKQKHCDPQKPKHRYTISRYIEKK